MKANHVLVPKKKLHTAREGHDLLLRTQPGMAWRDEEKGNRPAGPQFTELQASAVSGCHCTPDVFWGAGGEGDTGRGHLLSTAGLSPGLLCRRLEPGEAAASAFLPKPLLSPPFRQQLAAALEVVKVLASAGSPLWAPFPLRPRGGSGLLLVLLSGSPLCASLGSQ